MKQSVMWLALALLFAIGAILSVTADTFWPAATAETTAPATVVEAPQPVVAARAKPAEPEVPVAMLDDVPPRPAVGNEALARWFVAPGAPPPTRVAEALLAPLPLAPATTTPCRAARTRLQSGHQAAGRRRPANQKAQRQQRATARQARRTANARACGSPSRFSDLLRRLNLASRCSTRRSAA